MCVNIIINIVLYLERDLKFACGGELYEIVNKESETKENCNTGCGCIVHNGQRQELVSVGAVLLCSFCVLVCSFSQPDKVFLFT